MSKVYTQHKLRDMVKGLNSYSSITIQNSSGNCKHCFLDGSTGLANSFRQQPEKTLQAMKELFKKVAKLTFATNANNIGHIKILAEHFEMISCTAIPTGYHNGYQYHAIFFTTYDKYSNTKVYRKRLKLEPAFLVNSSGNKISMMNIDLEKVNAYKSLAWLKKYINKLFS